MIEFLGPNVVESLIMYMARLKNLKLVAYLDWFKSQMAESKVEPDPGNIFFIFLNFIFTFFQF